MKRFDSEKLDMLGVYTLFFAVVIFSIILFTSIHWIYTVALLLFDAGWVLAAWLHGKDENEDV